MDLTWDFNDKTLYWPGIQSFSYTKQVKTENSSNWQVLFKTSTQNNWDLGTQ